MSATYAHTARRTNRMSKIAAAACAIALSASAASLVFTLHHNDHHAAAPATAPAAHNVTPSHHVTPTNFVIPSHPVAPTNFVTPSHPSAPTNFVTPSHPSAPTNFVTPSHPSAPTNFVTRVCSPTSIEGPNRFMPARALDFPSIGLAPDNSSAAPPLPGQPRWRESGGPVLDVNQRVDHHVDLLGQA